MVFVTDPDDLDRFQVLVNPETERVSIRGLGIPDNVFGNIGLFNASSGINATTEVITTAPAHGFQTGEAVIYNEAGGTPDIGLTTDQRYWVNVLSTTTLSIHTSQADAIADNARENLSTGASEVHELRTGKVLTAAVTFASGDADLTSLTKVTFDTQDLSEVIATDDLTIVSGGDIGHYTIASIDDGNDFVIISETLAGNDNIVTDGAFPDASNWILQPSWTFGTLDIDAAAPTIGDVVAQDVANNVLTDSTIYEVTFECTAYTSGDFHIDIGGSGATTSTGTYTGGTVGADRSSAAVFTERLTTPGTTGQQIAIVSGNNVGGGTAFTGTVDNVVITALVTARIGNGASGSEMVGSEGGTVADGVSMQAVYSFLKEEWRTLSDTDMPDLIKFTFPIESITREQFEIGGPTHSNWDFEDATTRNLLRTGGWTSLNSSNVIVDIYPGIVTLGSVDSDTQVYFIQADNFTTTPTDFVLTGTVNQAINALTVTGGFTATKVPTNQVTGDVDFTAPSTIDDDAAGDFGAAGYAVGDKIQVVGATAATNNGIFTIATIVDDAATNDRITITETTLTTSTTDAGALLSPITDNRDFLKLFARKKARTYVASEIADIGVATIESIVNRFPLAHVSDPAITLDDGTLAGDPAETIYAGVDTAQTSTALAGAIISLGDGTFTLTDATTPAVFDSASTEVNVGDTIEITAADVTADERFYEILSVDSSTVVTCFEEPGTVITTDASVSWVSHTRYRSQGGADGVLSDPTPDDNEGRLTSAGSNFTTDSVVAGDMLVMTSGFQLAVAELPTGVDFSATNQITDIDASPIDFTDHGLIVGDRIVVAAAEDTENNGTYIITLIDTASGTNDRLTVKNTDDSTVTFTANAADTAATIDLDNFEGIYKVATGGVAATTLDVDLLDPDDHFPTSGFADTISFHVLQATMALQYREKDANTTTAGANWAFSSSSDTFTKTDGTNDLTTLGYVVGGNVVVASAEDSANNGTYIITLIDDDGATNDRFTVINTDGTAASFTLNATDTTAVVSGTSGHVRLLNGVSYSFNWRLFGHGGTLANCFEWIQRQLRRGRAGETLAETDLDFGQQQFRGDINDLLMAFSTPTGTTFNMFIDDLSATDLNNATKQDINGVSRNFAFIAGVTINLNDNITTASTNKVVVFFTDPDGNATLTTPVVGNEFNTVGALVVDDSPSGSMEVADTINSSETFSFDFDNNVQGGREPANSTEVASGTAVTIVSIATDTAQYVQTTGNILRQSTNIFSLVAALERNYSNP